MKEQNINPIKERRELMGLTQAELSEKSGLSVATIWNLENAFYKISIDSAAKIGKVFNLRAGTVINEWMDWYDRAQNDIQPG